MSTLAFFFFNDTATTEIYTLSLHDALPIYVRGARLHRGQDAAAVRQRAVEDLRPLVQVPRQHVHDGDRGPAVRHEADELPGPRSEEHTSELQSRQYLVCRLLLEKKKKKH